MLAAQKKFLSYLLQETLGEYYNFLQFQGKPAIETTMNTYKSRALGLRTSKVGAMRNFLTKTLCRGVFMSLGSWFFWLSWNKSNANMRKVRSIAYCGGLFNDGVRNVISGCPFWIPTCARWPKKWLSAWDRFTNRLQRLKRVGDIITFEKIQTTISWTPIKW